MTGISRYFSSQFIIIWFACSISGSSVALAASPEDMSKGGAKAEANSLFVSCSPDKPITPGGGSIQLRTWVTTSEGKPFTSKLNYIWSVSTGRIMDQTADARWDLEKSKPGNYVATVRTTARGKRSAQCALQIVVESPKSDEGVHTDGTRGGRETGRSFLLPAQQEHKGYGLYSYLLLGGIPSGSSRERNLKAIEAYLLVLPDISRLEKHFAPSELNITYLPVDAAPPNIKDVKLLAEWVLDHYDYPRARFLIRQLSGDNREGPYIVSVLTPLGEPTSLSHYLWQDLSAVPAQLAASWIKEFMNQAAQEHFWETRSLSQLRLKLRSAIAVLAMAVPDVQNSLNSYIKLGQSLSPQ